MRDLIKKVEIWAEEKGIFEKGSPIGQACKTEEEATELADAVCLLAKNRTVGNIMHAKDELGDVLVTIIVQCKMQGWDIEDCLEIAYDKISKRNGKMIDGIFVKE